MARAQRILVAADDPSRFRDLLDALRRTPHELVVTDCATAGERLLAGETHDLLLIDIEPPELVFQEVCQRYRRAAGPEAPILAISAVFERRNIEGMLENLGIRRLLPIDVSVEEGLFWVNQALFPEALRSRRTPRSPASFVLSVAEQEREIEGRALNLSEEGLFLETSARVSHGQRTSVRFELPGSRQIVAECEVVWVNEEAADGKGCPPFGIGLRFRSLSDESRGAIKAYVMQILLESTI